MNWNEVVTPKDTIYVLGDLSFEKKDKTAEIVSKLNGHKHLVMGNHDREPVSFYHSLFESVTMLKEINVEYEGRRQKIILCHYPLKTWKGAHRGAWNLHGHSHGTLEEDNYSLQYDVGVDCNGWYPVSLSRVGEVMATKTFRPIDHHGNNKERR